MNEMSVTYEHRQKGGWAFYAMVFSTMLVAGVFAGPVLLQVLGSERPASHPLAGLLVVALLSEATMIWGTMMMHSLTVRIEGQTLHVRFGPGVFRKRFDLGQVTACHPVRNTWLHGWGIHWMAGAWVYNIAGYDAVELEMRSGKRVRIGTDESDALADAIHQWMARKAHNPPEKRDLRGDP